MTIIEEAGTKLTRDCMKNLGFDWLYPPTVYVQQNQATHLFGMINRKTALRLGYHQDTSRDQAPETQTETGPEELSPAELLALTGVPGGMSFSTAPITTADGKVIPAGGCSGQARITLFGNLNDDDLGFLPDSIMVAAEAKAEADPKLVAAFGRWSACMKASGYSYRTPADPWSDPRWSGSAPSTAEIQAALTDIDCKVSTGLLDVWYKVDCEYQQAMVEQNLEKLNDLTERYRSAAVKASQLLGRPVPTS